MTCPGCYKNLSLHRIQMLSRIDPPEWSYAAQLISLRETETRFAGHFEPRH